MKYVVWGLVLALIVLHQDNWNWNNGTLVFGFMPITLLYHAGISLAAGIVWYMATIFAWPGDDLDDPAGVAVAEPSAKEGGEA